MYCAIIVLVTKKEAKKSDTSTTQREHRTVNDLKQTQYKPEATAIARTKMNEVPTSRFLSKQRIEAKRREKIATDIPHCLNLEI